MKATLKLEYIGADCADYLNNMRRMLNDTEKGFGDRFIGKSRRPWVAEITGKYPSGKFKRDFINPKRDCSQANGSGNRGVYLWFIIESGKLYEVHKLVSWKNAINYFCIADEHGDIYRLDDEEAEQWLNDH